MNGAHNSKALAKAKTFLWRRPRLTITCVALVIGIVIYNVLVEEAQAPSPPLRLASHLSDAATVHAAPRDANPALSLQTASDTNSKLATSGQSGARVRLRLEEKIRIPENLSISTLRASERPLSRPAQQPLSGTLDTANNAESTPSKQNSGAASDERVRRTADASHGSGNRLAAPSVRGEQARSWLAIGDAQAALSALGPPAPDDDVKLSALRAAALQRLGQHDEAVRHYRALTVSDAAQPSHWVSLGISLEGLEQREGAKQAYQHALKQTELPIALRTFASERLRALNSK